jgi:hypothetical protein
MTQNHDDYWSEEEIAQRLEAVRDELLAFLRERTRLEWFEHKVRWRLSRQYIWPAGGESSEERLDEAVEDDVGVEAFHAHLAERKRSISEAIERYNHAVRRRLEVVEGVPVARFSPHAREQLRQRRITFQGVHDELRRRARALTPESRPELIPELLSLRLAILAEDARGEVFGAVAGLLADERADQEDLSPEDRELAALEIELRLRCLDRYHVARLLAVNYSEARRFLQVDELLAWYQELARQRRQAAAESPRDEARARLLREVIGRSLGFLEEIFPRAAGTHEKERALLRG